LPSRSLPDAGLVAEGISVMETFARGCGYGLGEVFVDDVPGLRLGWGSLVDAVRVGRPVAVLVPDVGGLRVPGAEVEVLRARLRRVTNAPLVLARPAVEWPVPDAGPLPVPPMPDPSSVVLPALPGSVVRAARARRARSARVRSPGVR
jgi:hypothetical protein